MHSSVGPKSLSCFFLGSSHFLPELLTSMFTMSITSYSQQHRGAAYLKGDYSPPPEPLRGQNLGAQKALCKFPLGMSASHSFAWRFSLEDKPREQATGNRSIFQVPWAFGGM